MDYSEELRKLQNENSFKNNCLEKLGTLHNLLSSELKELEANIEDWKRDDRQRFISLVTGLNGTLTSPLIRLFNEYCTKLSIMTNICMQWNTEYKFNNFCHCQLKNDTENFLPMIEGGLVLNEGEKYNDEKSKEMLKEKNTRAYNSYDIKSVNLTMEYIDDLSNDRPLPLTLKEWQKLLKMDISSFKENDTVTMTVMSIENIDRFQFFTCLEGTVAMKKLSSLAKMKHLKQYRMPPKGEIFGLIKDGLVRRAKYMEVRPSNCTSKMDKFGVAIFIDLAEIECIDDTDVFYRLPEDIQELPSQAVACILCENDGIDMDIIKEQLLGYRGKRVNMHVVRKDDTALYVRIISDENRTNSNSVCPSETSSGFETNGFEILDKYTEDVLNSHAEMLTKKSRKHLTNKENKKEKLKTLDQVKDKQNVNDRKNRNNNEKIKTDSCNMRDANAKEVENNFLSDDEEAIPDFALEELKLYEETSTTSNPLQAVLGYVPKDERRICRFYEADKKGCFKGSSCRQEHSHVIADGWTKDQQSVNIALDSNIPTMHYDAGDVIEITPTYIIDVANCYCQVNDPEYDDEPLAWSFDETPNSIKLSSAPMLYDIVLAKYDDMWYRARIMNLDETGKIFEVSYVDYGNTDIVHLNNIAKCKKSLKHHQPRAIQCHFDGFKKQHDDAGEQKQISKYLQETLVNKTIKVKVISHLEDLTVCIIDKSCEELLTKLNTFGMIDTK